MHRSIHSHLKALCHTGIKRRRGTRAVTPTQLTNNVRCVQSSGTGSVMTTIVRRTVAPRQVTTTITLAARTDYKIVCAQQMHGSYAGDIKNHHKTSAARADRKIKFSADARFVSSGYVHAVDEERSAPQIHRREGTATRRTSFRIGIQPVLCVSRRRQFVSSSRPWSS